MIRGMWMVGITLVVLLMGCGGPAPADSTTTGGAVAAPPRDAAHQSV
jgi:hypothetical protein